MQIFTISTGIKSAGIEAKSPSSIIFRRFGSLVDVSGSLVSLHAFLSNSKIQVEYSVSIRGKR